MNGAFVLSEDISGVYIEQLPDEVMVTPEFLSVMDPRYVRQEGNADDGYRLVFDVSNGKATYRYEAFFLAAAARGGSLYKLLSWEPRHASP